MRDRKDCVLLSQKKCEKFEKRVFLEFWESNVSGTIIKSQTFLGRKSQKVWNKDLPICGK